MSTLVNEPIVSLHVPVSREGESLAGRLHFDVLGTIGRTPLCAVNTAHQLAKEEGFSAGIATAANVFTALEVGSSRGSKGRLIVAAGCSTGEKYLSTDLGAGARQEVGS